MDSSAYQETSDRSLIRKTFTFAILDDSAHCGAGKHEISVRKVVIMDKGIFGSKGRNMCQRLLHLDVSSRKREHVSFKHLQESPFFEKYVLNSQFLTSQSA